MSLYTEMMKAREYSEAQEVQRKLEDEKKVEVFLSSLQKNFNTSLERSVLYNPHNTSWTIQLHNPSFNRHPKTREFLLERIHSSLTSEDPFKIASVNLKQVVSSYSQFEVYVLQVEVFLFGV